MIDINFTCLDDFYDMQKEFRKKLEDLNVECIDNDLGYTVHFDDVIWIFEPETVIFQINSWNEMVKNKININMLNKLLTVGTMFGVEE